MAVYVCAGVRVNITNSTICKITANQWCRNVSLPGRTPTCELATRRGHACSSLRPHSWTACLRVCCATAPCRHTLVALSFLSPLPLPGTTRRGHLHPRRRLAPRTSARTCTAHPRPCAAAGPAPATCRSSVSVSALICPHDSAGCLLCCKARVPCCVEGPPTVTAALRCKTHMHTPRMRRCGGRVL